MPVPHAVAMDVAPPVAPGVNPQVPQGDKTEDASALVEEKTEPEVAAKMLPPGLKVEVAAVKREVEPGAAEEPDTEAHGKVNPQDLARGPEDEMLESPVAPQDVRDEVVRQQPVRESFWRSVYI